MLSQILILLIVTVCSQVDTPYRPHLQVQPPEQLANGQPFKVRSTKSAPSISPSISTIKMNNSILYPQEYIAEQTSCFGKEVLKILGKQQIIITANQPFVLFFNTKTASKFYTYEEYYGKDLNNIAVNFLIESTIDENGLHSAIVPLDLKCTYITNPYLRMMGTMNLDFYEEGEEKSHEFNFLLICASKETNEDFMRIFQPGYIFFWIYCNLVMQIYHGYQRTSSHFTMFITFFLCSLLIDDQLLGYIIAVSLFMVVLLMEKKQGTVNGKVFSLYLTFFVLSLTLIIFAYSAETEGSDWNSLWIALQNFIQLHITMFMVLRLIKLSRFRHVFWYFLSVLLFEILYQGNNNKFFYLNFKNPLDLTCLSADLFFPLMMLPISNYFTSLTSWMHRVFGLALAISALLPLNWAITMMATVIICVEAFEIKTKSLEVIKHNY